MSPGSQMRALTANKATPKSATIKIGKRVDRKKPKVPIYFLLFCLHIRNQETKEIPNNFFLLIKNELITAITRHTQPVFS